MNLVCQKLLYARQAACFVKVGIHYPDRAKTPAKGQHAGIAAANGKEVYFLGPLSKVRLSFLSIPREPFFFAQMPARLNIYIASFEISNHLQPQDAKV